MARNRPGAKNIIAIILGASTFPTYPVLDPSPAFASSAAAFVDYLRTKLSLPDTHILSLFDELVQPGQQLRQIRSFIKERMSENTELTDVIFYYCGHGAYLSEDEYVLALKCTDSDLKEPTVFKVSYLVTIIAELTRDLRNLVLLDACYSGAALGEFINMSEQNAANAVSQQIYSVVPNPEEAAPDTPDELGGAILFCAAGPKKWAKTPLEGTYTMFSGALKAALDEGDPKGGPDLTVKRLAQLVEAKIRRTFGAQAVKPQIHVPVQGASDLLDSPFFPNPAFGTPLVEDRLQKLETMVDEIRRSIVLLKPAKDSTSSVSGATTLSESPAAFWKQSLENFVGTAPTLLTCLGLDVATYYGVKLTASGMSPNDVLSPALAAIAVAHIMLITIAILRINLSRGESMSTLRHVLPNSVSYPAVVANSFVMFAAVFWMLFLPAGVVMGMFEPRSSVQAGSGLSSKDLASIQRALCLPPTGSQGPETRAGVRDYLIARNYPLDSVTIVPSNIQLFDEAVSAVGNCEVSEFKNSYEVGAFAIPPARKDEKVKDLQKRLHAARGTPTVTETGIIDSQTRKAIIAFRRGNALDPGDTIDSAFMEKLKAQ